MKTIYERISEAVNSHPETNTEELATEIYGNVTKKDLRPLLFTEVRRRQRLDVQHLERSTIEDLIAKSQQDKAYKPPPLPKIDAATLIQRFSELFDQKLSIDQLGHATTWGQATIDEHKSRVAMLTSNRVALDANIERHRLAIRLLQETGSPSLEAAHKKLNQGKGKLDCALCGSPLSDHPAIGSCSEAA